MTVTDAPPAPAPAEEPPPVQVALARAMNDVRGVGKNDRNDQQRFMFRGIDAVLNAVGPALRSHGVIPLPSVLEHSAEYYESKNGGRMKAVTLLVRYTFVGPRGDTLEVITPGESADSGDKAYTKAMSVAFRTALIQALALPTDERDPDADVHERAPMNAGSPAHGRSGTGQPQQEPQGGQPRQGGKPTDEEIAAEAQRAIQAVLGAPDGAMAEKFRDTARNSPAAARDVLPLLGGWPATLANLGLPGEGRSTLPLAKFAATVANYWQEQGHSPVLAADTERQAEGVPA